mgnify:CR=1 FL=1
MKYALLEEAGDLKTGTILSEAESSCQVELDSGRRVKAKLAQVLLRFDQPASRALLPAAAPDRASCCTAAISIAFSAGASMPVGGVSPPRIWAIQRLRAAPRAAATAAAESRNAENAG